MGESGRTIVMDMGSRVSRVGFSGEDEPRAVMTSVVGRPKHVSLHGAGNADFYVGEDAEARRGALETRYPVENGVVVHWDDWERMVERMGEKAFGKKGASDGSKSGANGGSKSGSSAAVGVNDPFPSFQWSDHPVLFSAPLFSPHHNEQKIAELLFEAFHVPSLGGALAPALALWGTCHATGLVVQIGHDLTQIVPIYDNKIIEEAAFRTELAGAAQTRYLATILTENSKKFTDPTSADLLFNLDGLKRTCCYTAANFAEEMVEYDTSPAKHLEYTFSDGRSHLLRTERFRVGELLFKPKTAGYETKPLHKLIYKALMKCPMDLRKSLGANISLTGAASLLPGLPQRIETELAALLPAGNHIKVNAIKERSDTTWRGGALLSSFSSWSSHLFTKQDYEEHGAAAVHRFGFLNTQLSPQK